MKVYLLDNTAQLLRVAARIIVVCLMLLGACLWSVTNYKVSNLHFFGFICILYGICFRLYVESIDHALKPLRLPRNQWRLIVTTIVATGILTAFVFLVAISSSVLQANAVTIAAVAGITFLVPASSFFWFGRKVLISGCVLCGVAFVYAISRFGKPNSVQMLTLLVLITLLFWVTGKISIAVLSAVRRWAARTPFWSYVHERVSRVFSRDAVQVLFELYCIFAPAMTRNVFAALPLARQERCVRIALIRRYLAVFVYCGVCAVSILFQIKKGHVSLPIALNSAGAALLCLCVVLIFGLSSLKSVIDSDRSNWVYTKLLICRYLAFVLLTMALTIAYALNLYPIVGLVAVVLAWLIVEMIEKQILWQFLQRPSLPESPVIFGAISFMNSTFGVAGIFVLLQMLFASEFFGDLQPLFILGVALTILWRQEKLIAAGYLRGQLSSNVKVSGDRTADMAAFWIHFFRQCSQKEVR